jgi:hypothetical protein
MGVRGFRGCIICLLWISGGKRGMTFGEVFYYIRSSIT